MTLGTRAAVDPDTVVQARYILNWGSNTSVTNMHLWALMHQARKSGARIVTIADSYDTITSDRSYKKGRTAEQALGELERCAGTQFDPELVQAFVRAMRQLPNPIIEVASLITRNS